MTNVDASEQDLQCSAGDNESKVKEMAALVPANDSLAEILTGFDAMDENNEAAAGDDELRVENMAALALSPANDGMDEILACFAMDEDNIAVAEELKVGGMAALAPANDGAAGFDAMEEDNNLEIRPEDLWLDGDDDNNNNRNHDSLVDDATIFCNDSPLLPDIPCMSSSSSTPSTPAAMKPLTTTSSTSTAGSSSPLVSWTMMNSESNPQRFENGGASTALEIPPPLDHDIIDDIIENLQFLFDCNEIWDPSSIFQTENQPGSLEDQHATATSAPEVVRTPIPEEENNGFTRFLQDNRELTVVFLDWCTKNKHQVSAEAVRSIEVKHSTIVNATQRLGTTSEDKKKLLILILEWAKYQHLRKKRLNPNPNPNFICNPMSLDPIAYCPPAFPWLQTPINSMGRYSGYQLYPSPYLSPMAHQVMNGKPYPVSAEYGRLNYAQSWAIMPMVQLKSSHYPDNGNVMNHQPAVYRNPSVTKEARKKRILRLARKRRLKSLQHHHSRKLNLSNVPEGVEDGVEDGDGGGSNSRETVDVPTALKQAASDRPEQQVWKNMMLLIKKVLKQSDVGSLGRIVLPKKEAESYLPKLETKDWITIPIEDIGNSPLVWNMRYRYWPNHNSRMYLLENTGDFVKLNGLQEGDFIFLYWHTIHGKYMIRGVKVPEPEKTPVIIKPVIKKPRKKNVHESLLAGNSSSLAPNKKAKI